MVYEKQSMNPVRPFGKKLYGWDPGWEYRHTDVFPTLSRNGEMVITQKQLGDSSVVLMNYDSTTKRKVYDPVDHGQDPVMLARGQAGAFQPAWSPDGEWFAFGVGGFLTARATARPCSWCRYAMDRRREAADRCVDQCHFPSYSADGRYRLPCLE